MDLGNNRDHYYLAGPMGNHVGMQVDADGDDQTDRELMTQVFDAFDVAVTPGLFATGRYAFRGQEGSATDDSPGLIEMGARSYDPQLGRFIQADSVPVASLTTQGLNRYIYAENDPANFSDPIGYTALGTGSRYLTYMAGGLLIAIGAYLISAGVVLGGIAAMLAGFATILAAYAPTVKDCNLRMKYYLWAGNLLFLSIIFAEAQFYGVSQFALKAVPAILAHYAVQLSAISALGTIGANVF